MKRNVRYSTYVVVITTLIILLLAGIFVHYFDRSGLQTCIFGCVVLAMAGPSLLYAPLSLSADDAKLAVRCPLRTKEISLADIRSVKLCPPTMGAQRICGSGGFFGYWGWFSERDLGKYFAYYGKSSDCFLVTLKDGRKYMLGCEQPQEMIAYLEKRMAA